ncbi:MAG: electron transport complex subunit RsxC [Ruminococcaceae bacterium]|nr:electron transport complex subunit RsxC [Oscillospiraceae bacterium]
MAKAFFGGIHPDDMKAATNGKAINPLPHPPQVIIYLGRYREEPCTPLVRVGDHVKLGQKIGEPVYPEDVAVYASVSGTVTAVEPRLHAAGGKVPAVVIENDGRNERSPDIRPVEDPNSLSVEEMIERVRSAGIVDAENGEPPVWWKISHGIGRVDTVIINGAECEPYLTADHRTMLERPEQIVRGCAFLARMFHLDQVIIGVEVNKKNGITALKRTIAETRAPVVVTPLGSRYPQGSDKQLCQAITGRQIPPGAPPEEIGCAVFDVQSVCSIYRAITSGMPVVRQIVTVSGSGVMAPGNVDCPIGTPVSCLLDACGGLKDKTFKLIVGGPMTGTAQSAVNVSVDRGTVAVLAFAGREGRGLKHTQCIRCGRCARVCPMRLQPVFLYRYAMANKMNALEDANLMDCMECGACAYVCPAQLPLVQIFREGKARLMEELPVVEEMEEEEA